jgi:hypothetical protein
MVSPLLPGSQSRQACVLPAIDDGPGTCLLDGLAYTWSKHGHACSRCVHIFLYISKVMTRRYSAAAITIAPCQRGPGFSAFFQNRPSASDPPGTGSNIFSFRTGTPRIRTFTTFLTLRGRSLDGLPPCVDICTIWSFTRQRFFEGDGLFVAFHGVAISMTTLDTLKGSSVLHDHLLFLLFLSKIPERGKYLLAHTVR